MENQLGRARIEAVLARSNFFLTQGRLEAIEGGYRATILNDGLIATTGAGRKEVSHPKQEHYRLSAGGALLIYDLIDGSVAPVRYRDPGAPSWGDHWTLGSGLAGSIEELVRPDLLAVREGVEEFIAVSPDGLVVPVFEADDYTRVAFGAVGSAQSMLLRADLPDEFRCGSYRSAEATFMAVSGEMTLSIGYEGGEERSEHRGLVVIDEGTRGVDLIKVIRIAVNARLADFAVYDGEGDGARSFNAPIGCLRVEGNWVIPEFVATYQSGRRIETMAFNSKVTPILRAVLEASA